MSNVAAVIGALTAGIVGGSLFAVALVAQPQTSARHRQPRPVMQTAARRR